MRQNRNTGGFQTNLYSACSDLAVQDLSFTYALSIGMICIFFWASKYSSSAFWLSREI